MGFGIELALVKGVIEKPLTTQELCEFLRLKKSTLDQYNHEGLPRFFVGKECRYIPSKVIEWLERRSLDRTSLSEEAFDPRKEILNAG